MKVILQQRVAGLGEAGDLVEVAPGYARNLLLPRGLAVEATAGNLGHLAAVRARAARQEAREEERAREARARLQGQTVLIRAKAGNSGRLFGSVTAQDVASALTAQFGIEIDRRRIEMPEPFKALGEHAVELRLYRGVAAQVRVQIEAQ